MSNIVDNPRGGCVLGGLNATLSAIDRVCPVFHSGPGCCMQATASEQSMSGQKMALYFSNNAIPCDNMQEKDVIFGGVDRLEREIRGAVEVIDADAYFIIVGCAGGVIGDDVQSVAEEMRAEGQPVYAVDTPGFFGSSSLGYEEAWKCFLNQIVEEQPKQPDLVNLLGIIPYHDSMWSGNLQELARILRELGLEVNTFFTGHQDLEAVRKSSAAALNIIVSPWLLYDVEKLYQERFAVPSLRFDALPVGATDTTAFVRKVAAAMNIDSAITEKIIAREENYVYSYLAQILPFKSWERFGIIGDAASTAGITRYLANDFGFTPKYVIISEDIPSKADQGRIRQQITQLEYARAPRVYFTCNQFDIDRIIHENTDVSLIIGSVLERDAASDIPGAEFIEMTFPVTGRMFLNRALAGYHGSLSLTEDLYDHL